jgi:hypothetical protein
MVDRVAPSAIGLQHPWHQNRATSVYDDANFLRFLQFASKRRSCGFVGKSALDLPGIVVSIASAGVKADLGAASEYRPPFE